MYIYSIYMFSVIEVSIKLYHNRICCFSTTKTKNKKSVACNFALATKSKANESET